MKKWSLRVFCNLLSVDRFRAHTNLAAGHIYKEKALRIKSYFNSILFIAIILATSGCKDTLSNLQSKPTALGRMNEIVAICDAKIWARPCSAFQPPTIPVPHTFSIRSVLSFAPPALRPHFRPPS